MTHTTRSILEHAIGRMGSVGIPTPEIDAELMLGSLTARGRGEVQAAVIMGRSETDETALALEGLVDRRVTREPLQHILGVAPFRSMELLVGPGVFVPRPETEQVVQFAIDTLLSLSEPEPIAVDLGTGSGAIALAMATEVPHAQVYAVEKMPAAYAWAGKNVAHVGATNVTLVAGDLADALAELDGSVAVLVSNPPYIPDAAIPRDPEVRLFDPPTALYGGPDGLDPYRVISRRGLELVRPGGLLVLEHGELQGAHIRDLLVADGWNGVSTHQDFTLRDRTTVARRP